MNAENEHPRPPVAQSLPDNPADVQHDPPNPAPAPISETETPRDAIFLTEAQALRQRVDAIGAQLVAQNLMIGAAVALAIYLLVKGVPGAVAD